jgi:deoxyribonuclease V
MILAVDVHYREAFAKAVSIEFGNWDDTSPTKINEAFISETEAYVPGAFYKRELPCILEVLKETAQDALSLIIVDGYVFLDDDKKAGLGKYLYDALGEKNPVVGVGKNGFANNTKHVIELKRGESKKPLFVTSIGIDVSQAANHVQRMAGAYRMPDLLRLLDRQTKI